MIANDKSTGKLPPVNNFKGRNAASNKSMNGPIPRTRNASNNQDNDTIPTTRANGGGFNNGRASTNLGSPEKVKFNVANQSFNQQ